MKQSNEKLLGLYVITDHQHHDDEIILRDTEKALRGGAKILQYRDKSDDQDKRCRQARLLRQLTRKYQCTFIINDDIELAIYADADGIHLGGEDASIPVARAQLGDNAIIGASCYNQFNLAIDAEKAGADYVAFGRFFTSKTKPGDVFASSELLTASKNSLNIPTVAIGGISYENASPLIAAGANMIAVINGVFGQQDIELAARQLQQLFNKQD